MQADVTINSNKNWSYNKKEMDCLTQQWYSLSLGAFVRRIHEQVPLLEIFGEMDALDIRIVNLQVPFQFSKSLWFIQLLEVSQAWEPKFPWS